jgi:hypothetical protein
MLERRRIERREKAEVLRRIPADACSAEVRTRAASTRSPVTARSNSEVIDGRARIEVRDVPEHPLRAAALIEVIVNERDPRAYCWRGSTNATM